MIICISPIFAGPLGAFAKFSSLIASRMRIIDVDFKNNVISGWVIGVFMGHRNLYKNLISLESSHGKVQNPRFDYVLPAILIIDFSDHFHPPPA